MFSGFRKRRLVFALAFALSLLCAHAASAQDEFGDDAADPVKLFKRGEDAHAKKDYEQALEFYEEAIKLRPEFPEAEFQKASALVSLNQIGRAHV